MGFPWGSDSDPASKHGHPTCGSCSASRHEEINRSASRFGSLCFPALWETGGWGVLSGTG